jgi:hypothetical protein
LSPVQQLQELDRINGKGKGAGKQRAKIAKRIVQQLKNKNAK